MSPTRCRVSAEDPSARWSGCRAPKQPLAECAVCTPMVGAPIPALLRRAQRTPSSAGWKDTARKVRNLWRNRSAACHHSHVPHARCYPARIMQLAPCAYVDVCPLPRCDCTRWRRFQRQRCARRASTDATVTVRLARGAAGPQVRRYRCCAPAAPRLAAGARTSETPNGEAAR
jgi:hypothetical protein